MSNKLVLQKQKVEGRSSCEAEYRVVAETISELTWLKQLLQELGVKVEGEIILWCDNVGATSLTANPVHHARTKHMEIDVHFVPDKVLEKELEILYVPLEHQIEDVFNKAFSIPRFQELCNNLTSVWN